MASVAPTSVSQPPVAVGTAVLRQAVMAPTLETATAPSAEAAPATPSAAPTPASALASAVSAAAARQDGLGPLLADLAAALKTSTLPPALKAAIQTVARFQLPTAPPPTAAQLRQAVAQSGLFLEARMAAQPGLPPADFKLALANLSAALTSQAADKPAVVQAEPAPPPPYQDGPQRGQPALAATLPPQAELQAVVGHLQRRVAAAQSRVLLQQAASATGRAAAGPWLFELPLATPQGAAIAQFQIDADEPTAAETPVERTWRARFTLDLAGIGPVHAHLALRGEDLMLGLFAEDEAAAVRLDEDRARLATALQAEALNPQIAIRPGSPHTATPPAGRFVDGAA